MKRIIPLKANKDSTYVYYLSFLNSLLPKESQMNNKQLELAIELVKYNDKFSTVPEEVRHLVLFSSDIKKEMMENLNMTASNFNTYLSQLRNLSVIKDNKINKNLCLYIDKEQELEVIFKFNFNVARKPIQQTENKTTVEETQSNDDASRTNTRSTIEDDEERSN